MTGDNGGSPATPKRHTFACVRCSERKVKCDRQDPCNACIRHNAECIFRAPKPPRRKRHQSKEETVELLKHYEGLLRTHGIDPNEAPGGRVGAGAGAGAGAGTRTGGATGDTVEHRIVNSISPAAMSGASLEDPTAHLPTPASSTFSEGKHFFKPQLLHGQSGTKFVDNSLWSRVAQEMRDADDSLEEEEESTDEATELEEQHQHEHSLRHHVLLPVFAHASHSSPPAHPPPAMIRRLSKIFLENVNPLYKLIHVPTFQPALEKAIANLDRVPRQFEALMFAIYTTAINSMKPEDCKEEFGSTCSTLARRFNLATQKALTRAKFMSTTSLVVLQALLLYIISIREDHEPRAVWNLTGLAMRIAEGMGMRIDGAQLGLPPFETEMRRRLWWQLSVHDFRCAEMCGQAKIRLHESEKGGPDAPTNVDDADLDPGMTSMPVSATGVTEMLWVMFRTELSGFARGQLARMKRAGLSPGVSPEEFLIMDNLEHKDRLVKSVEDLMETKYLRYCDPTQPLHLFTLLATRAAIKLMRFMCHHPRRWALLAQVPDDEKQLVWEQALAVLQTYQMMQSSPVLRCFQWSVPYFIQWHVVIHILDSLRAAPLHPDADRAWSLIDSIYEHNSHLLLSTNRPVFMAVGNLCLKAVDAREAAAVDVQAANRNFKPVWPEYVSKLREQREAARSRRAAAAAVAAAAGGAGAAEEEPKPPRDLPATADKHVEAGTSENDPSVAAAHTTKMDGTAPMQAVSTQQSSNNTLQQGFDHLSFGTTNNNTGNHGAFALASNNNSNNNNSSSSSNDKNNNNSTVPHWLAPAAAAAAAAAAGDSQNNFNNTIQLNHANNYWLTNAATRFHYTYDNNLGMGMGMGMGVGIGMGNGGFPSTTTDTDMLDFDSDAILAQGFSLDTPNGQVVDWGMWDSFFGAGPGGGDGGGGDGGGGGGGGG